MSLEQSLVEWDRAGHYVRQQLDELVVRAGLGEKIRRHVAQIRGYPQVLYMCAAWLESPQLRFDFGTAFCMHAVGLKLLDDLIDADQDQAPRDLLVGHIFCDEAVRRLHAICPRVLLIEEFADGWLPIWRYVLAEPDVEVLDLQNWESGCRVKSGRLMALYAGVACRAAGHEAIAHRICAAMEAIGTIYMIWDDFLDRLKFAEARSNLAELLASRVIRAADAAHLLNQLENEITEVVTAHPPVFQFQSRLNNVIQTSRRCIELCHEPNGPDPRAVLAELKHAGRV
jgi:hypothetical protein